MEWEVYILNLIFLIFTTVLACFSLGRILRYRSRSMGDYAVCLVYLFNCFPAALDLTLGIPDYVYWYDVFEPVMGDFLVCLIYNLYLSAAMLALSLYAARAGRTACVPRFRRLPPEHADLHRLILLLLIAFPLLLLLIRYGPGIFSGYTPLTRRNVSYEDTDLFFALMPFSVYLLLLQFFSPGRGLPWRLSLMGLLFLLIWVNGKRYAIATTLESFFFMYQLTHSCPSRGQEPGKRVNLTLLLALAALGIVFFSVYYMSAVKISEATDHLYGTLRVDFGRDDVTKYVIQRVLLEGRPILDYPGQTFLSLFLFWVPRSVWPGKPYPHFRYLTGSILNLSIMELPSGTTPSLFEMGICNFGWLGMAAAIALLLACCRLADRSRDMGTRLLWLNILTVLLSQSIDAVLLLALLLIGKSLLPERFRAHFFGSLPPQEELS